MSNGIVLDVRQLAATLALLVAEQNAHTEWFSSV